MYLWWSSSPLLSFQLKLQRLKFQTENVLFILGTTAQKSINFHFSQVFLNPLKAAACLCDVVFLGVLVQSLSGKAYHTLQAQTFYNHNNVQW